MAVKNTPSIALKNFLKNEIKQKSVVLDIGCGEGSRDIDLALALKCRIYALELDRNKIRKMKEKYIKKRLQKYVKCYLCDALNVNKKFGGRKFDIALIIHTLHHIKEINESLPKIRQALNNSGRTIVAEYTRKYGEKRDNCPRFSSDKIRSMLKTAGFRRIRSYDIHEGLIVIIAIK